MTIAASNIDPVFKNFPAISEDVRKIHKALDLQNSGARLDRGFLPYALACDQLVLKSAKLTSAHKALKDALQTLSERVQSAYAKVAPSELLAAIRANRADEVDRIFKVSTLKLNKLQNGEWPVHYAIHLKCYDVVKYLLNTAGLDPLQKDRQGLTSIDHAALMNDRKMLATVLGAVLRVDISESALADPENHVEIGLLIQELQKMRHLPYSNPPIQDWNPLHRAAFTGDLEVLEDLFKHKFDLNGSDLSGMTPLHLAALGGQEEVVARLLKKGAKITTTASGMTLLHLAAISGSEAVLKILLETKKYDPNVSDRSGRTPLHFALAANHLPAAQTLIEYRANPLIKTMQTTPFTLFKMISLSSPQRDPLQLDRSSLFTFAAYASAACARYCELPSLGKILQMLPIFGKLAVSSLQGPLLLTYLARLGFVQAANLYFVQDNPEWKFLFQGLHTASLAKTWFDQMSICWGNSSFETLRPVRNMLLHTANLAFAAHDSYQASYMDVELATTFKTMDDCQGLTQDECIKEAGKEFGTVDCVEGSSNCRWGTINIHRTRVSPNARLVLGLSARHTKEQCSRAFKKLSRQFHPDKNRKNPEATQIFSIIGMAKKILCP